MKQRHWLSAILDAIEDDTIPLPWIRSPDRKKRKAAARARAEAQQPTA